MAPRQRRNVLATGMIALLATCAMAATASSALALTRGPGWAVDYVHMHPTNLPPGGSARIEVDVYNIGGGPSSGPVTVTDVLPPHLSATTSYGTNNNGEESDEKWNCSGAKVVKCTSDPETLPTIQPGELERFVFVVQAEAGAGSSEDNRVTVAGGEAPAPANASNAITVSSAPPPFGFTSFDGWATNVDGTTDTQAGSHPYEFTVSFDLAHYTNNTNRLRNLEVELPPGLIGDPNAVPQCTRQQLDDEHCPASSQIGVNRVGLGGEGNELATLYNFPIYNMVPPPGLPAQFAFGIFGVYSFLDAAVRSNGDYGITEHVDNIPENYEVSSSTTVIWGVPGDPSHDSERCATVNGSETCGLSSGAAMKPLLTMPTSCGAPPVFKIRGTAWQEDDPPSALQFEMHDSNHMPTGFTGCEHLGFNPSISVSPDTSDADTPAGLTVEVKTPQEGLAATEGVSISNIADTTVTLPAGVVVNPGQAAGLTACQSDQDAVGTEAQPSCPAASKVGTVAIETPLLRDKLEGNVYILQSNPPNLQLLLAASGDGVNLKLIGDVHLDEATGQLQTTFQQTPELPFTNLKLSFTGGAQAALATPLSCGTYTTTSDFIPWSAPFVGDVFPSSSFAVEAGPGGSACTSPQPFSPAMIAGATTDQAGGFTDFSLLLQRADGQQRVQSLQFKTPEGLLGMIGKIPLCGEPAAAQGACPAASQIGHTVVAAGPGPYPLVVPEPGQPPAPIYLTGSYKGAPYGLSIAVPVIAGPFNLGTVVVRARIEVDPHTTQLTITTDELPRILDGIPTDLRTINAVIDRPGFMFNPTDCQPMSFSGTAYSTEGASTPISSHFQVGSCQALKFKPNFKVSTSGKTSRANGASLTAKILYPTGALADNQASSQSNIASVKVELPKKLPSRLTTLQKACPAATFEADPARCPSASAVGHATALTPVLPVPLTGPAYFVSHGGEAFPSLIVVLQGYGATVDLVGTTFISKQGITSSTFKQVPDVPITSFELVLPEGPYSALAANGDLCKSALKMPTHFVAHNGAVIDQSTKIAITGCGKAKRSVRSRATRKAGQVERGAEQRGSGGKARSRRATGRKGR